MKKEIEPYVVIKSLLDKEARSIYTLDCLNENSNVYSIHRLVTTVTRKRVYVLVAKNLIATCKFINLVFYIMSH